MHTLDPVPNTFARPERKAPRGFLDFVAVSMAAYALWATTPVGALMQKSYNFVTGSRAHTRPLMSYFRTDTSAAADLSPAVLSVAQKPPPAGPTDTLAAKSGVSPALARAVCLVASNGKVDADGHYEVVFPRASSSAFAAVGVKTPPASAKATLREAALIEGVGRLKKRLGSEQAAVASLAMELTHVKYALDRARAAGLESPDHYASFRNFLPHRDRDEADALVNGTFALAVAFDLRWPVPFDTRVSSPFGDRNHPTLGRQQFHTGVDLAVPVGSEVHAIATGKVLMSGHDAVNGKFVKIDHGHGLTSAYCHGSELRVGRGDVVKTGDRVLDSGATGRVSGPHLHFQLEIDGVPVDPVTFRTSTGRPLGVR